jgi:hypothetical protein
MRKVTHTLNYVPNPNLYKTTNQPSLTVPDETMSLRTILDRFSRGLPITGQDKEPIYNGEDGLGVDIRTLDISEREEIAEKARRELKEISDRLQSGHDNRMRETLKKQLKRELLEEEQAQAQKKLDESN